MNKKIKIYSNKNKEDVFILTLSLDEVYSVYKNSLSDLHPKLLMKRLIEERLKFKNFPNYKDYTKFEELYSDSAFFLISDENEVIYCPLEDSFIKQMEHMRKSFELKGEIWKDLTIDSFYLAYFFFRDCLKQHMMLIKMDFTNSNTEFAFRDSITNSILTYSDSLNKTVEKELIEYFNKFNEQGNFATKMNHMLSLNYIFRKEILDYAIMLFNRIKKIDIQMLNQNFFNYCQLHNITVLMETNFSLSNKKGFSRNFIGFQKEGESLGIELSCEKSQGDILVKNRNNFETVLVGNIKGQSLNNDKQFNFDDLSDEKYKEKNIVVCEYQVHEKIFKTLEVFASEKSIFLPQLNIVFIKESKEILMVLKNVLLKDFTEVKIREIKSYFLKEILMDNMEKDVDDFIELLYALIENNKELLYIKGKR